MLVSEIVKEFDIFLSSKGLKFETIIIGGAALSLLGIIDRETQDIDCLKKPIPDEIKNAAVEFADLKKLDKNWLNCEPYSLKKELPRGWEGRLIEAYNGASLSFRTLGRSDLLKTKLFALADRGTDWDDVVAMKPTKKEITESLFWVQEQDQNEMWADHVKTTLSRLCEETNGITL